MPRSVSMPPQRAARNGRAPAIPPKATASGALAFALEMELGEGWLALDNELGDITCATPADILEASEIVEQEQRDELQRLAILAGEDSDTSVTDFLREEAERIVGDMQLAREIIASHRGEVSHAV